MSALPSLRPRPGNLREIAEKIEEQTGLRVQVLGGSLVMSPTPRGKHAGTIRRLRLQLDPGLPAGLAAYEVSSVAMPDDPDDYATPDLIVLPEAWDDDDNWLADAADVELAVEVISQSEKARDIGQKNDWYAVAGVKALLVIDPRYGTWAVHLRPGNGTYQQVQRGKHGDDIALPPPLELTVATDSFPLYGVPGRGADRS
ncbi:Uma2 family endonuclease [Streptomyces sp. NPDC057136]|uniref:Uma2 family endonuclease n=1 Tax=Streptomyces sp. NPDC057136 TaxID=3346029 RepID=UPI003645D0AE